MLNKEVNAPALSLSRDAATDDGEEPPRLPVEFLLAAVGEKEFGAADGAERQHVDAFGGDARLDELFAVGELNVGERVPVARGREQRVRVRKLRAERFDDFRADLVAAGARRRAYRRDHVPWVCPELLAHARERAAGHLGESP